MIFLNGLWHGLKVISTGLYWLGTLYFVWAAFIAMRQSQALGWAMLLMVAGVFVGRIYAGRVFKSPGAAYVGAAAIYAAAFAWLAMHFVQPTV